MNQINQRICVSKLRFYFLLLNCRPKTMFSNTNMNKIIITFLIKGDMPERVWNIDF